MKTAIDLIGDAYDKHGGYDFSDLWSGAEKLVSQFMSLLSVAQCPSCDGSGAIHTKIRDRCYVTHEMALDAQCPEMEGSIYCEEEWDSVECQWCAERKKLLGEKYE